MNTPAADNSKTCPGSTPGEISGSGKSKQPRRRRFSQFSILGLLALIAIVSGALGVWTNLLRSTQSQWDAVRPLMERGIRVETSPSTTPEWVKQFLPEGETENVSALQFAGVGGVKPGDLDCLGQLPHLKWLQLDRCQLTDKEVERISRHEPLELLAIGNNSGVTNASAAHLIKLPNLTNLGVSGTSMDWRAFIEFSKRPGLNVEFGKLHFEADDSEIETLAACMGSKVERLFIRNGKPSSIRRSLELFDNLYYLEFDSVPPLTSVEFKELATLEHSDALIICANQCENVDASFWKLVSEHFEPVAFDFFGDEERGYLKLKHRLDSQIAFSFNHVSAKMVEQNALNSAFVNVRDCSFYKCDDSQVELAKEFKQVASLGFYSCTMSDFEAWGDAPKLKELKFKDCSSLQSIERLSSFQSLDSLELSNLAKLVSLKDDERTKAVPTVLKRLDFSNLPSLRDFAFLGENGSLEVVKLYSCSGVADLSCLTDFSGLSSLRWFEAKSCKNLKSVNGLRRLAALEQLRFTNCISIEEVSNCDFAPNTKLRISGAFNLKDFSSFKSVSGLSNLELHTTGLETCKHVEELSSLRSLTLLGNRGLRSIKGLEKLPNLKSLDFSGGSLASQETKSVVAELAKTLETFSASSFWQEFYRGSKTKR